MTALPVRMEVKNGLTFQPPTLAYVDCVRKLSLNAFIDHYQKWCKRRSTTSAVQKAVEIYEASKELVSILPKDDLTKLIIKQAVEQLNTASQTVEQLRTMMNEAASKLPEYPVVMAMKGVGKISSILAYGRRLVMSPDLPTKEPLQPLQALIPCK